MTTDLVSHEQDAAVIPDVASIPVLRLAGQKSESSSSHAGSPTRSLYQASESTTKARQFKQRFADEGLESLWGSDTEDGFDVASPVDLSEVQEEILEKGSIPSRFGNI